MKLSELLAMHPQLDVELGPVDERVFLDGVYLFRVIDVNDEPGKAVTYMERTPHTDEILVRGLVRSATEILVSQWPVHICEGGEH